MQISRAQFLATAGIAGAAAVLPDRAMAATARKGLTFRGVGYEVTDGGTAATGWNAARMRTDMHAIRNRLHAGSVSVFGDGVERLTATATEAAERGLHVWLQPRFGDQPEQEILQHLAETGLQAEALRRQGARINLSVGCEFVLFVPGIVPGADALERIANLLSGNFDPEKMQRRLHAFIQKAAATGRSVFRGRMSYAAAQDDEVDWNLFDIVSIDYYSYFRRRADYVRELRKYQRWGKPVTIAEFGCCTYAGAPQAGGMGWDVVDYSKNPEEIRGNLVRSEETQAAYLLDLLEIFESMGLYSATVYDFATPDAPHRADPKYDLDMASYSIVKAIEDPGGSWHWEPKAAFHALSRHFRAAACR